MDAQSVYRLIELADLATATATNIYAQITSATGKTVEELRAERDALSQDTHAIIEEELAKLDGK